MISRAARIDLPEFRGVLDKLIKKWGQGPPRKLGLAVSGGVDSMALATLCMRAKRQGYFPDLKAFVVDHKLRDVSTQEAQSVQRLLEEMGIETEVLSAAERPEGRPEHLERWARRLRFRLLSQACYRSGINGLLLAHHADDQAETVLYRLGHGYYGGGLAGVRDVARTPESEDLYGSSGSGKPRYLTPEEKWKPWPDVELSMMKIEGGGVDLLRPFLAYDKAQLIATCEDAGVPWVEDETNADVSLAARNATRYLLQSDLLPAALRKSSILQLAAAKQKHEDRLDKLADRMIKDSEVQYELAYGRLYVDIPVGLAKALRKHPETIDLRTHLLRTLMQKVMPLGKIEKNSVAAVAEQFLAENAKLGNIDCSASLQLELYAMNGKDYRYVISRRNPQRDQRPSLEPEPATIEEGDLMVTPWMLFDRRYWIRLGHRRDVAEIPAGTTIRHLEWSDFQSFTSNERKRWKRASASRRNVHKSVMVSMPVISNAEGKMLVAPSVPVSIDQDWHVMTAEAVEDKSKKYFFDIHFAS